MPKQLPPHVKIQRAKVIVDNEGQKFLMTCESCGADVYLREGQTICEKCSKRKKSKPRR
jgi:hypothetical protein